MTDVTKMLDGQVAGVHVHLGRRTAGQRRRAAHPRLPGRSTLRTPRCWWLTACRFDGDLNSINSSDIESMSVLKTLSAGALYRGPRRQRRDPHHDQAERRTGRIAQREPERQRWAVRGPSLLQHDVGPRIYGAHVPGVLQRSGLHGGLSSVRGSGDDRRPAGAPDSRHGQYL